MIQRWPARLWVVRHGQSAGNVARDAAHEAGLSRIDLSERDVDVPLSMLGESQAAALGRWFCEKPEHLRPDVVITSPYARARGTGDIIRRAGGVAFQQKFIIDERLREKEFGDLDRLTRQGILELFPAEAEKRHLLGKFYYRPPGGESWCDVILRLRGALDSIYLHQPGRRVLVLGHQVIVLCIRYLLEGLSEQEILSIDALGDVANCAVTEYRFEPAIGPVLERYNFIDHLNEGGAAITAAPDDKAVAQ